MKKGLLVILSGPSGVGKGTIREYLMKDKNVNLQYSISMTTRSPRNGEINGKDYFFVTREEFLNALKHHKLLEHAKFVDNYYGTPKDYVEKLRNEGKNVLLEIETRGAKQIIDKMHSDDEISIFLVPPSLEELEKRIRGRKTETEDLIKKRMAKAKRELKKEIFYDYIVENDTPENAANKILNIILSHIKKDETN